MSASVPAARERRALPRFGGAWLFALLGAWMFARPVLRLASDGISAAVGRMGWTDAWAWADSIAQLGIYAVPLAAVAVGWGSLGRNRRIAVGAMLGTYVVIALPAVRSLVQWSMEFAGYERRANAMMRPARLAMRVPPEAAAVRALAAGDSAFLAVVGEMISTPGVHGGCLVQRYGERAIRGTSDGMLTPDHVRFQFRARDYAARYNATLAARLGLSRARLAGDGPPCEVTRRARPWPSDG